MAIKNTKKSEVETQPTVAVIKASSIFYQRKHLAAIRSLLSEKSGNKCAFPNCQNELVTLEGRLLGEICSIIPMNPTHPRGVEDFSQEQHSSIENYILLCPYHHRLIDAEPDLYTVEHLKKMIDEHKQKQPQKEAGKQLPSNKPDAGDGK